MSLPTSTTARWTFVYMVNKLRFHFISILKIKITIVTDFINSWNASKATWSFQSFIFELKCDRRAELAGAGCVLHANVSVMRNNDGSPTVERAHFHSGLMRESVLLAKHKPLRCAVIVSKRRISGITSETMTMQRESVEIVAPKKDFGHSLDYWSNKAYKTPKR